MHPPTSPSIVRNTLSACIAALVLLGFGGHARADDCYPGSLDTDGDGYAAAGTASMPLPRSGLGCPSGYVPREGDCNDHDRNIHPRNWENAWNAGNNIDDDCDGEIDEPEPVYPASIYQTTYTSGFIVPVRVNARVSVTNVFQQVYVSVWYQDLSSYTPGRWQKTPKIAYTGVGDDGIYRGWVDGYAGGAFRASVMFYDATKTNIIAISDYYHVVLDPNTNLQDDVAWARYFIANAGLRDLLRSEHGELGYRGSVKRDGTAYGAALNEQWCSEFYAVTASTRLVLISEQNTTGDLRYYFSGAIGGSSGGASRGNSGFANAYFEPSDRTAFRTVKTGDYLAIDSDRNGDINHSGMTIAYNGTRDVVVSLEGNSGNEVALNERPVYEGNRPSMKGNGKLQTWMLPSSWQGPSTR